MLIGHNPGLQQLALDLARPTADVAQLAAKYPTAALAPLLVLPARSWRLISSRRRQSWSASFVPR